MCLKDKFLSRQGYWFQCLPVAVNMNYSIDSVIISYTDSDILFWHYLFILHLPIAITLCSVHREFWEIVGFCHLSTDC